MFCAAATLLMAAAAVPLSGAPPMAQVNETLGQNVTAGAITGVDASLHAAVDSRGTVVLDLEAAGRPIRLLRNPELEAESAPGAGMAMAPGAHSPGGGPKAHAPEAAEGTRHAHADEVAAGQDPETRSHRRGVLHRWTTSARASGRFLSDAVGRLVDDFRTSVLLEFGYQRELGYPAPPDLASMAPSLIQLSGDTQVQGASHGKQRKGKVEFIDTVMSVASGVAGTALGLSSYGGVQAVNGDLPFLCICDAKGNCKDSCGTGDVTAEGACTLDPSKSFCKARTGSWNGAPLKLGR